MLFGNGVGYGLVLVQGGDIVVRSANNFFRAENFESSFAESIKSLGRSNLVAVKTVNVQLTSAALNIINNVRIPNFIKQLCHQCHVAFI